MLRHSSQAVSRVLARRPTSLPRLVRCFSNGASATTTAAALPTSAVASFSSSRPRVVVLGCGWAGFRFLKAIDRKAFDVVCISPRNHFVFTPLLPSTTVGTLEFRTIIEPVRTLSGLNYMQAECLDIDHEQQLLKCKPFYDGPETKVPYDFLVIACGAQANTFNVPGVREHGFFLKDLNDARSIRLRILENFERASNPDLSEKQRSQLLTFVCVGGGPTSVEFAGELHDFLKEDVIKWYPDLVQNNVRIILIEATDHILGTFDRGLSDYVMDSWKNRRDMEVRTLTHVQEVKADGVVLKSGETIPCGLVVWSTGVAPSRLVSSLAKQGWDTDKRSGRLLVDHYLRLKGTTNKNIFALGDCAVLFDQALPPTAQVAQRQGKYLAKYFNKHYPEKAVNAKGELGSPFQYKHMGMLAYVGGYRALADLGDVGSGKAKKHVFFRGFSAWLFWRSAYFTRLMSIQNKILVPMYWFKSFVFGRDISRF